MSSQAIDLSREARRIYLIAIEVRRSNPSRGMRLIQRARELAKRIRVLVAVREIQAR